MIKLSRLLTENTIGTATVDYLSNLIRNSPFKGQVFVAGGYVRDELLGKPSKDIDLVITAPDGGIKFAEWITKKLGVNSPGNPVVFERFGTAKFNLRGVKHNGFDLGDLDIEAVMTRTEKYKEGSRKPEVGYGSLKQDAERRDFTVNSLMKDLTTGETLDLTGMGIQDLKDGVVRSAMDPNYIFQEDPLRMLRAIRFATKYNWELPDYMMDAVKANAEKLSTISAERIQDEFNKMLTSPRPAEAMQMLVASGLSKQFIPELDQMIGVTQNQYHKDDVFTHSLEVLSKAPGDGISRLAALLHDVGKPATRTDVNGKVQFLKHEDVGADMARDIMTRLKYPNASIDTVGTVIKNHMRLKPSGPDGNGVSDKALRKFVADIGDVLPVALGVMDADNKSHAEGSAMPNQINGIRARLEKLPAAVSSDKIKLPINGHDIMQRLGVKPGPVLAMMLDVVKDAYFDNPDIDKESALNLVDDLFTDLKQRRTAEPDDDAKLGSHLPTTIRNPNTDNEILLKTALGYDADHPARKAAERVMKKAT